MLKTNIISIIGARKCSKNGEKLAEIFSRELVEQNITICSGLARGIDSIAHRTTIDYNGKTIAVLGCGFNNIYPPENTYLYKNIIKNDGLIISEYPPEEMAKSIYFLERNRIVSGISIGILVVEAKYRSGTSVTAKLAKEQGKEIFAIPHEIYNKDGIGTNKLIQNGAILVTSAKDIISKFKYIEYKQKEEFNKSEINGYQEIFNELSNRIEINNKKDTNNFNNENDAKIQKVNNNENNTKIKKANNTENNIKIQKTNNNENNTKNPIIKNNKNNIETQKIENDANKSKNIIVKNLPQNKDYKEIYELIFEGNTCLDEIYRTSTKNITEINNILLMLEIEGYIKKYPKGYKCIN